MPRLSQVSMVAHMGQQGICICNLWQFETINVVEFKQRELNLIDFKAFVDLSVLSTSWAYTGQFVVLHCKYRCSTVCTCELADLFSCLWRVTDGYQKDTDGISHVKHQKPHVYHNSECLCICCMCAEKSHHAWIWIWTSLRRSEALIQQDQGTNLNLKTCAGDQTRSLKMHLSVV